MPNSGRKKVEKKDKVQQKDVKKTTTTTRLLKLTSKLICLTTRLIKKSTNWTLIGLSQFYNPDMDLNLQDSTGDEVLVLTVRPKPIKTTAVKTNRPFTAKHDHPCSVTNYRYCVHHRRSDKTTGDLYKLYL